MKIKGLFILMVIMLTGKFINGQSLTYSIRVNQLGYLPNSVKIAAVVDVEADSFKVMKSDLSEIVFKGLLLPSAYYSASDENVRLADFTLMNEPGSYVLVVDNLGKSVPFEVSEDIFSPLLKATIKYYYYNRASMPVLAEFGGAWAREAGHPDTAVVVLPSAATVKRPAGTIISTPAGWYDAGDYNKYIVSSGGTVFTLLSAYETYPEFYDTLNLNIPESGNVIPDILDEALWNIKWMMSMQDEDGGVYNKTTEASFSGFDMPSAVNATRYVTAKGTAATLDFAAIMAMTSRIYRKFDTILADSALNMAIRAWNWAKSNPNVVFKNPGASGGYPGVSTGEYSDAGFEDEFTWCAAELYVTTKDSKYYNEINFNQSFGVLGWPTVSSLALLSMLVNQDSLTEAADISLIKSKYLSSVSGMRNNIATSPYRLPGDFYYWGGNNAFANWGMMFMQAFRITGDASYYNGGVFILDYLLGKNATTYCFVTGFGSKSPRNPHHRISVADGVADPVPGMLVGGAASGDGADCGAAAYPSELSAKSYLDAVCSYSTNEVAIGYNSGLVFLTGALIAEYQKNFTDSMPRFFSVSRSNINLPHKPGNDMILVLEGNTDWELVPSETWISISNKTGSGNASVLINSNAENQTELVRTGKIYVFCQSLLKDSIMVNQNGRMKSFRIEAEDFLEKFGTQNESTADAGGGLNVGYIDVDNWLTYSLDIAFAGLYDVTFRHAGYAGDFDVYIDDVFLQNVKFPKTADWQVWANDKAEMILQEGQQVMKLEFNSVGTNLNWYQFDWKPLSNISTHSTNFKVYPNPANGFVYLEFDMEQVPLEIALFSIDGNTILKPAIKGETSKYIDVSAFKAGYYLLKIRFESNTITESILIK